MAKIVQIRRGTAQQHEGFEGREGEITVDLTDKTIRVHDGVLPVDANNPTGIPLSRADMANVSDAVGLPQLKLSSIGNPTSGQLLQADGAGNILFVDPVVVDVSGSNIGGDLSGTIGNAQIVANAVGTTEIADLSVTNDKLADNTIQVSKLTDNCISVDKIQDNAIITSKITNLAVNEVKLASNSVSTSKILDANVTTDKLADLSVTSDKLAVDSVVTNKIIDAGVTDVKIQSLSASKLTGSLPAISGASLTQLPYDMAFAAGYDADLVVEDLEVGTYGVVVMGRSGIFDGEVGTIENASANASVICDIELNGSSIYATPPRFDIGSSTLTGGTLSTNSFSSGDNITFKIAQIGSGTIGSGVRFLLKCRV
tara:strand:- start:251 stop:1360 length:1110 start_codon:yes stop_codon:yes gene_type:complete